MTCNCTYKTVKVPNGYRLVQDCTCSVHAAAAAPSYPPPIMALLAKHGLKPAIGGLKYSASDLDSHLDALKTNVEDRMAVKSVLRQIGSL